MRFYKEVWGIIWEFNGIGEYISFIAGRVVGAIIFVGMMYLLVTCSGANDEKNDYEQDKYPAEYYYY